jgi:competence protein ComEA
VPALSLPRPLALAGAALLLLVLVVAGRLLAGAGAASAPEPALVAAPVRAEPEPPLVVHVVGAVRRPGLYRLARGRRVADAVARAGGAAADADLGLINLAAPVADGQQVIVPARSPAGADPGAGAAGAGTGAPGARVSLSTATLEQLDELPGVGPVTAQKIVDYRERHGAFTSIRELDAIPGIGPARIAQLEELVVP